MSLASRTSAPIGHTDRFYIGGQWVTPSSGAVIDVIDPGTEELFFSVAEAQAAEVRRRSDDVEQIWPRESGGLPAIAGGAAAGAAGTFDYYAELAGAFPFEEPAQPTRGGFGLVVREPVGVVGAVIPWNAPMGLISMKLAPALIAGCTVVLKTSPEAPGEGYLIAEAAEAVGLPPGWL